jgi:N-dimethylarginine dimethylaminohydrolase
VPRLNLSTSSKLVPMNTTEWGQIGEAVVGAVDEGDSLLQRFQPELLTSMRGELDTLAACLEANCIKVRRPVQEPTDRVRSGTDNVFVRDSGVMVDRLVIETELRDPDRRRERYAIRPALESVSIENNLRLVRMAQVHADGFSEGCAFLEGGDVLLTGGMALVGHSGRGSSEAGIAWLRDTLPRELSIHRVSLKPAFQHLDLAFMLVRSGLAVCYPNAFPEGLPACIKDWELIHITEAEARSFAANGLMLNEANCLLVAGQDRLANELEKRGITVEMIPFSSITRRYGGLRCATLALRRD